MNIPKIHIELVPKTCWFSNVRSQVSKADWDIIRKSAYAASNHKCNVCGSKGRMEAHEIWHYDDQKLVQKLFSIISVCKKCHELYHLGYTSTQGKLPNAIKWLSKVNGWSLEQTSEYVNIVFEVWHHRSQKKWHLDLSLLDKIGVKYSLINPQDRVVFSEEQLKNKLPKN